MAGAGAVVGAVSGARHSHELAAVGVAVVSPEDEHHSFSDFLKHKPASG